MSGFKGIFDPTTAVKYSESEGETDETSSRGSRCVTTRRGAPTADETMAGRRVPALAFLAAFLVAFNVFSSHGADRPSPRRALGDLGTDAMAHVDGSSRGSLMDAVGHVGERGVFEELAARAREGHPLDSRDPDTRRRERPAEEAGRSASSGKCDARRTARRGRVRRRRHPTDVITNAHRASEGHSGGRDLDAVSDAEKRRPTVLSQDRDPRVGTAEPFTPAIAAAEENADADAATADAPKAKGSKSWFGSSGRKRKVRPDRFVIGFVWTTPRTRTRSQGSHRHGRRRRQVGGDQHKRSPRECHDECELLSDKKHNGGCNVWVYCPLEGGCGTQPSGACWLKRQGRPEIPTGVSDETNPWISGSMAKPADVRGERGAHKKFHVLVTTNANVYQAWQVRVMHYWYERMRERCEDEDPDGCQMGGFTRILHDKADALVDEIPTCVVDRLDNEMGFVVLSRPNAFKQYFEKCGDIEEDYVLMAEPDHLYLRPLANLMNGRTAAAFPFFYINPKGFPELIRRFAGEHLTDQEIEDMDPIGSSPVFIHKEDLRRVGPIWHDVTLKIKQDREADKAWGWVLEMYGYTIASKIAGVRHDLRPALMAQPPWDKGLGEFFILHFTYGMDYDRTGFHPGEDRRVAFRQAQLHGGHTAEEPGLPSRVRQRAREATHRDDERGGREPAQLGGPLGRALARDDGCFGRGGWRIPAAASARGQSGRGPARGE